jgi:hypothetical protein
MKQNDRQADKPPKNSVSSLSQLFKYLMTELDLNASAGAVSRHYFGGKPARYLTEASSVPGLKCNA